MWNRNHGLRIKHLTTISNFNISQGRRDDSTAVGTLNEIFHFDQFREMQKIVIQKYLCVYNSRLNVTRYQTRHAFKKNSEK